MRMQQNSDWFWSVSNRLPYLCLVLLWSILPFAVAQAENLQLQAVDAMTVGDKLQVQLSMDGNAPTPQVFQTDNPARIALDFANLKNGLHKKMLPINSGVVSGINVLETEDRTRVVINLLQSVPYQLAVTGNQVLLTLGNKAPSLQTLVSKPAVAKSVRSSTSAMLPRQGIGALDFKRGDKGEGRIIISLASVNTVVNSKESGGKVIVNFLNTALASSMGKHLDVSDFATPVKTIDLESHGNQAVLTVTPVNANYDYSSYQIDGTLTLEFRPLTQAEKAELDAEKFPYKGERLSLNFQDIEIRSVLQILADFTKLNVVAADNVTGKITLQMNDIPWDQALDLILKSKGLSKRQNGNVILVAPTADINKIETAELAAKKVAEQLEPLKTEYIQINYAKAENFRSLIMGSSTGSLDGCNLAKSVPSNSGVSQSSGQNQSPSTVNINVDQNAQQGVNQGGNQNIDNRGDNAGGSPTIRSYRLLSIHGTAIVDGRTNTLIVKDTAQHIAEIRKLIELLDKPVRQVMIEARIAIATDNFARTLGVRFGAAKAANLGGGKTFAIGGGDTKGYVDGSLDVKDMLVDMGATAIAGTPPGALGMTLARGADYVLNLELSALQDTGNGEVLSNPRIMTSDRCKAVIKQGLQIPYTVATPVNNGGVIYNTMFKDASLKLDVTPQITPSGSITMNLSISKDEPDSRQTNNGNPIHSREVDTTVTVNDGETVVLGGVFESDLTNNVSKVPILGDIPGIGYLFTKRNKVDDKRELLVFVTPKVVNSEVLPKLGANSY